MYRRTHQSFTLMTKLTCMILSLLLIVCAVPTMPVWAEDVSTAVQAGAVSETTATSNPEVEPAAPTTGSAILSAEGVLSTDAIPTTVTEVTSLREESIKHFKLPDGTYQAVIYADAVHRMDSSGQWQNIDNRLYLSQDSKSNTEAYRTTDGRTSFAKSYTANQEIFSLTENGYAVSVSMISNQLTLEPIVGGELVTQAVGTTAAAASTVTVTNAPAKANPHATEWASIEAALKSVGGDNGSIVYTNVAPHTDLEYVLQGNDVKENIIVKATSLSYVYRFRLELTGLTATLTDSGTVSLRDTDGIEQLVIPAPYMYDAAGEVSYAVTYGLATNIDGSYTLTVTADPTWVNDADRVFPVTIDPSIVQRGLIFDTFVSESNPSTNYFDSMDLWVGANTDGSNEYVTLVYASIINQLPSGYRITSAYLDMTYYYYLGTTSGNIFVAAFRILNDWDPATITWNQYEQNIRLDSIVSDGQYLEVDGALLSSPGSVRFDITADVTWWYNGTRENHGLVLKRFGGTKQSVILNACENEIDGRDPTITINYTPEIEEGVYAFENIGNAGLWMDTQYNSAEAGMRIQQYAYSASPTTTFERGGLFKISNVSGTQRYVMRLMTNNHLGVLLTGDKVISYEIPGKDADVPIECTVYLFQQDDGTVMIRPANSSKCITANATTASGSAGAPASYLTSVAATEAGSQAKWRMVKYTGDHASGVYLMREGNAHAGLSITVTPYYWSTYTGVNIPSLYLSSLSTDIASLSWNANTRRATIYIYNEGTISVNCTVKNAEGTSSYTVNNFSINAVLPVEEGVYYIKNGTRSAYMQIPEDESAEGTGIIVEPFTDENHARWELTHISSGLYIIELVKNGKVLTVSTSSTSQWGEQVRLETNANSSGQMWKITRTARGTVIITPAWDVFEDLNGCISAQYTGIEFSGLVVHQYYHESSSCEWNMYKIGTDVMLLGITDTGHDHLSSLLYSMETLGRAGYDGFNIAVTNYTTVSEVRNQMEQCQIYISRSHGSSTTDYSVIGLGQLFYSYHIYDFATDTPLVDLSGCDLMLFVACKTAGHETRSLHHAAAMAGAKVAIGFKDNIGCSSANTWTETFVEEYTQGTSVTMAAQRAAQKCEDARLYEYDFAFGH